MQLLKYLTWLLLKARRERENTSMCLLKLSFISSSSHVFHLGTYRSLGAERTLCHARACGPRKISGLKKSKFLLFVLFFLLMRFTEETGEGGGRGGKGGGGEGTSWRLRRRKSCKGIRSPPPHRIRNDKILTKYPHMQTAKGKRDPPPPPLWLSNSTTIAGEFGVSGKKFNLKNTHPHWL